MCHWFGMGTRKVCFLLEGCVDACRCRILCCAKLPGALDACADTYTMHLHARGLALMQWCLAALCDEPF